MKKLRWTQRIAIQEGIQAGKSNAEIAREIGVHRATVGREIARNAKGRENYRAHDADLSSWERQKEAMPKRFLVRFNGVEFLSTLNKRNKIYTYISRTHLNALSRDFTGISVEAFQLRSKIYDFRCDWREINHFGFSISDFGVGEKGISKFGESFAARLSNEFLFTQPEFLNEERDFQTFSSVIHKASIQKEKTFIPFFSQRIFLLLIQQRFESLRAFYIQKSLNKKTETTAPFSFSNSIVKFPAAA